jgi:hypothetical protein
MKKFIILLAVLACSCGANIAHINKKSSEALLDANQQEIVAAFAELGIKADATFEETEYVMDNAVLTTHIKVRVGKEVAGDFIILAATLVDSTEPMWKVYHILWKANMAFWGKSQ